MISEHIQYSIVNRQSTIDNRKMLNSFRHLVGKKKPKEETQLETYKKILEGRPDNLNIRLKLGDLYAKLGDKETAIKEYTTVAVQHADEGYLVKAIAVNKHIVRLDPSRKEALDRLSELYFQRGVTADPLVQDYRKAQKFEHAQETQEEIQEEKIEIPTVEPDELETAPEQEREEEVDAHTIAVPELETPAEETQEEKPELPTIKPQELELAFDEELEEPDVSEFLKKVDLFHDFNQTERRKIAEHLTLEHFSKGTAIIHEGESGDCMYVLKSGKVGIYTILMQDDGVSVIKLNHDRLHLATLQAGDFFGEQALITKEPRSATVLAETEEVQVLKFTKHDLALVVKQRPRVGQLLKKYHQQRVKETMESLKAIW